jgi:hypothetical protein
MLMEKLKRDDVPGWNVTRGHRSGLQKHLLRKMNVIFKYKENKLRKIGLVGPWMLR